MTFPQSTLKTTESLYYTITTPLQTKNNDIYTSIRNIAVCHKQEECDFEKFWKLESIGIEAKEQDNPNLDEIVENYTQNLIEKHKGKCIAKLPWKEHSSE